MLYNEDVFGIDEELDTEGIESPGNSFRGLARVGPGAIADADADSDSDLDDADTIGPSESNASSGGQPMRGYGFRIPRKGLEAQPEDDLTQATRSGTSLPISVPLMHMASSLGQGRGARGRFPDVYDDESFLPPHVISSSYAVSSSNMFAPMYIPETGVATGLGSQTDPRYRSGRAESDEVPNLMSRSFSMGSSLGALKGREALRLREQVLRSTGSIVD